MTVGPHASRPVADASGRQEPLPIGPTFALFQGRLLRLVGRALDRRGGIHTAVYPWLSKEAVGVARRQLDVLDNVVQRVARIDWTCRSLSARLLSFLRQAGAAQTDNGGLVAERYGPRITVVFRESSTQFG